MTIKRVHAFKDDALGDLDACGVSKRISTGEVSAREVMEAAVARAREVDGSLRTLACEDFERAMFRSNKPKSGVFAGVPTAVKDNTDSAGLPTQSGSSSFRASVASTDGQFVSQILDTGMISLGKTRLPEFALNAGCEFSRDEPVRNPWNLGYSAGGSSGGAAALVASGVVPLAHATDAGGSIRIPAAACGLVGLKPSRGRIVQDVSEKSMPIGIAVQGVLTRSVRDTARIMYAVDSSNRNSRLRPVCDVQGSSRTRLKIGVLVDSPVLGLVDAETRDSVRATAELLESLGHYVEETPSPVSPNFMKEYMLYLGLLASMIVTAGKYLVGSTLDRTELENSTLGLAQSYKQSALRTPVILHRLRQVQHQFRSVFDRYDVLLSPVVSHLTPEIGFLSPEQDFESWVDRLTIFDCFAPLNNISGTPAISLPLHQSRIGLPLASQLSADLGDERTLLELAFELEEAQPWERIQDPVPV